MAPTIPTPLLSKLSGKLSWVTVLIKFLRILWPRPRPYPSVQNEVWPCETKQKRFNAGNKNVRCGQATYQVLSKDSLLKSPAIVHEARMIAKLEARHLTMKCAWGGNLNNRYCLSTYSVVLRNTSIVADAIRWIWPHGLFYDHVFNLHHNEYSE